jgi:hypothetical protein
MAVVFTAYVGFSGPGGAVDFQSGQNVTGINRALLLQCLEESTLEGYTVTFSTGYYGGQREAGATVVVIDESSLTASGTQLALTDACNRYKELAHQEQVWITVRDESLIIL